MGSYAATVRREKEAHPERFCPKCLWRRHVYGARPKDRPGAGFVTVPVKNDPFAGFWLVPCPKHEEVKHG